MASSRPIDVDIRNALKHGPSAPQEMPDEVRGAVARRSAEWRPYYDLPRPELEFAFARMILASVLLDRCQAEAASIRRCDIERARTRWDEDRRARAHATGRQLARHPESVAIRLEQTSQGVDWKIARWKALANLLGTQGSWSFEQISMVLDLLGTHPTLRAADPVIDYPERLIASEIARLEGLKARSLDRIDSLEREAAMGGAPVEPSATMRRLRRYEAALRREYDKSAALVHELRTWPENERRDKWTCPTCTPVPALVSAPEPAPAPAPEPESKPAPEPAPEPACRNEPIETLGKLDGPPMPAGAGPGSRPGGFGPGVRSHEHEGGRQVEAQGEVAAYLLAG